MNIQIHPPIIPLNLSVEFGNTPYTILTSALMKVVCYGKILVLIEDRANPVLGLNPSLFSLFYVVLPTKLDEFRINYSLHEQVLFSLKQDSVLSTNMYDFSTANKLYIIMKNDSSSACGCILTSRTLSSSLSSFFSWTEWENSSALFNWGNFCSDLHIVAFIPHQLITLRFAEYSSFEAGNPTPL